MIVERCTIVIAFITERDAEAIHDAWTRISLNEHDPVVVADLVPEVSQQGPLRLMQSYAATLTLVIVGLCNIDRNHTVKVSGHNLRGR